MYLDGDTTKGLWSVLESQLHVNELKLKAVHFPVQAFGNSITVAYVNAMGDTKSPYCI